MTVWEGREPDAGGEVTPDGFEDQASFILGLPKSGTTLLQSLLDGHPQLLVDAAESKFLTHWWPRARDLGPEARADLGVEVMLREFGADSINGRYLDHLSRDAVVAAYRELVAQSLADRPRTYLLASLLAYGQVSGQLTPDLTRWVEKTPVNDDVFPTLRQWWPEARAIRVVRDPRANYVAEHRIRPYVTAHEFADRWRRHLDGVRTAQDDPQQLVVRYEELAADPDVVMAEVAAFLDIEPLECLTQPTKAGGQRPYGGNSSTGASFAGVSAARTERWRSEASSVAVAVIESVVGPTLEEFGYRPSMPSVVRSVAGPSLRTWQRARDRVGHLRRSLGSR